MCRQAKSIQDRWSLSLSPSGVVSDNAKQFEVHSITKDRDQTNWNAISEQQKHSSKIQAATLTGKYEHILLVLSQWNRKSASHRLNAITQGTCRARLSLALTHFPFNLSKFASMHTWQIFPFGSELHQLWTRNSVRAVLCMREQRRRRGKFKR